VSHNKEHVSKNKTSMGNKKISFRYSMFRSNSLVNLSVGIKVIDGSLVFFNVFFLHFLSATL